MPDQPLTPAEALAVPAAPGGRERLRIPFREQLAQPSLEYRSAVGKWLRGGESVEEHAGQVVGKYPWWKVIWLTGVDYFSTLGYQPGIALLAAGAVAPIATVILVLVTLFGALPVYAQVAKRSYAGQGSIAMLENLLSGWKGKGLVLVLLGFAATDFVITMTLSAADAAKHAIENPFLHPVLDGHEILVTLAILTVLAAVFLRGFHEAIGLAALAAVPYLLLNLVVLARGAMEIIAQPALLVDWRAALAVKGNIPLLIGGAVLVFPKLALGLSGFETGVSVMPLIDGGPTDRSWSPRTGDVPMGRVANTRKLLVVAAVIMSGMLILSSVVTTLLIAPADYAEGGKASGRAIAFLAHRYLGSGFGTVYDVSTILILGLAGASAMAGLLHLIPATCRASGWRRGGPRFPPARAAAVRRRRRHHPDLRRVRGGTERRLRHRGAGADPVCRPRGDPRSLARASPGAGDLHGHRLRGLRLHLGGHLPRAPRRPDHRDHFHGALDAGVAISRSLRSVEFRIPHGYFYDAESWRLGRRCGARRCTWCPSRARRPKSGAGSGRRSCGTTTCAGRSCSSTCTCSTIAASSPPRSRCGSGRRAKTTRRRCSGRCHRQHDRLCERGHRSHLGLHRPHPARPDGPGDALPDVR